MSHLSLLCTFVLVSCSITGRLAEVVDEDIHGLSPYFPDHKPYLNSSSFRNASLSYNINIDPSNQGSKKIKEEDVVAKLRFHIVMTNDTLHKPDMKEEHKDEYDGKHQPSVRVTSQNPYFPPVWTIPTKPPVNVEKEHSSVPHHKDAPVQHELHEGLSEHYYGQKVEEKITMLTIAPLYTTPHPGVQSSSTTYPTTKAVTTTAPTTTASTTTKQAPISTTQVYKTGANKVVVDVLEIKDDKDEGAVMYGKAQKKESEVKEAIKQEDRKPEGQSGRTGSLKARFEIDHDHDMPLDEYEDWMLVRPVDKGILAGVTGEVERMDNVSTTTVAPERSQQPSRPGPEQQSSIRPKVDLRDVLAKIRFHIFRINEILQVVPELAGGTGRNPEPPARIVIEGNSQGPSFTGGVKHEGPSAPSYYEPRKDVEQKVPYVEQKAPYVEQKAPYVEQKAPYVEQKAPYVEQKAPYVEQKAPYVEKKSQDYVTTSTLPPVVYQAPPYASPKKAPVLYAQPTILGENDNVPSYVPSYVPPVQYVPSPFMYNSPARLTVLPPPSANVVPLVQASPVSSTNAQPTVRPSYERNVLDKVLTADPYDPVAMQFYREVTNSIDYSDYEDAK